MGGVRAQAGVLALACRPGAVAAGGCSSAPSGPGVALSPLAFSGPRAAYVREVSANARLTAALGWPGTPITEGSFGRK